MAYTIECSNPSSLGLDEYVAFVTDHVDLDDQASICESADALAALANNKTLLSDYLNGELSSWQRFQASNTYTAQSFMLARANGFYVRANIWQPREEHAQQLSAIALDKFFYHRAHDHNFDFMTVGYLGPGYETTIYEYEYASSLGITDEEVALTFLECTTLTKGKVMMYRKNIDIHSQSYPASLSVSLNLMISNRPKSTRQYFFDVARGRLAETFSPRPDISALCEVASLFGNAETASLLEELTHKHSLEDVRYAAFKSLAALESAHASVTWSRAYADNSPRIQMLAKKHLDECS